ncbi:glycosyltransferase [Amycolatopsis sp. lyj-108]|uniref:glycosyltransferase n=1 Tax=Amycolatopsis sp. lyj-108 TaxID=2789286 RepID=UPI00397C39D0
MVFAIVVALSLTLSIVFLGYMVVLSITYLRRRPGGEGSAEDFEWHFLIPCRDEEAVIGATLAYLRVAFPGTHVWVVDDASEDSTRSVVSRLAATDDAIHLISRELPNARTGKGDALNAAYQRLLGTTRDAGRTIVGVVDADGRPASNCLAVLAAERLFGRAAVGAVQIEVRMMNRSARTPLPGRGRTKNLFARTLVRMQDLEFRGPIAALQLLRRRAGTAAMGGNGQFTRLSALRDIDCGDGRPWRGSLLEDFELGVHLLLAGSATEFTVDTWVEQEALPDFRRFVTQRTRWGQGVMQCARYLPRLWRSDHLGNLAVLEMSYYLFQPWLQLLGTFVFPIPIVVFAAGIADRPDAMWSSLSEGLWALLLAYLLIGIGQFAIWGVLYRNRSERGKSFARSVGWGLAYVGYVYVFYLTSWRAATRLVLRRNGWAKTRRNSEVVLSGPVAKEA